MRRKANKLVDLLANQGVIYTNNREMMNWQDFPRNRLKMECQNQANEDNTMFLKRAMEVGIVNQQLFVQRYAHNGVFSKVI